jgi:chemotaxis protein MotB
MSRRRKHEEHLNHEAWAIPYGDLVTLLLAFFVVMYAVSSINEGKYRVLSDSLAAAFAGSPKTVQPIQIGEKQVGSGADIKVTLVQQGMLEGQPRSMLVPPPLATGKDPRGGEDLGPRQGMQREQILGATSAGSTAAQLKAVASDVEKAMAHLIKENLVVVRRHRAWVEVEIRTDILFPSGVATLSPQAEQIIRRLAETLKTHANPIRVEGHTDNVPIHTLQFRSNWDLSAARAASVVHLFTESGIDPERLAIIGLGEYRPARSNATPEGRNANRRVVLVIMGVESGAPEGVYAEDRGSDAPPEEPAPSVPETPQLIAVQAGLPTTQTTAP